MLKLLALILVLQIVKDAKCEDECILDLGIVLDSSVSIWSENFIKAKTFLQNLISEFEIGPEKVRVSLISYGEGIYLQESFNLPDHTTDDSLREALGNITYKNGQRTDTGAGIKHMINQMDAARQAVKRVAIVLTDGNSRNEPKDRTDPDKRLESIKAAEKARQKGIRVIAVGVGNRIDEAELKDIADSPDMVIQVANYAELDTIKKMLAYKSCKAPTTAPHPRNDCGHKHPSDIYFVFSPMDLGSQTNKWVKTAMSQFVRSEEIKDGFQVGLVIGECHHDGFDLDQYLLPENKTDIMEHLQVLVNKGLSPLVQQVLTDGGAALGGRPDVRNVVVLVAPGGDWNIKLRTELVKQAENLVNKGNQVFILDPFSTGVYASGAVTISDRSHMDAATTLVAELCDPSPRPCRHSGHH